MTTQYKILSIDAWANGDGGWDWNAWYDTGETINIDGKTTRQLLADMRAIGLLSDDSKGRVTIDDDGYNLVIVERKTREPFFAVEYGGAK